MWTRRRIVDFHTYMTGELFALLREHSILGRPAREAGGGEPSDAAFERGVAAVRDGGPAGATALLFSARTLVLGGLLPAAAQPGLPVGPAGRRGDCAARCPKPAMRRISALVGEAALCARYQRALALFGRSASLAGADAAAQGLWQIAQRAGLCAPAEERTCASTWSNCR